MNIKKIIKEEVNRSRLINEGTSPTREIIEIGGKELEVTFRYEPEEPPVRYYGDGSGYPGSPAEFDFHSITYKGRDVSRLLSDEIYKKIEEILEEIMVNNANDYYENKASDRYF